MTGYVLSRLPDDASIRSALAAFLLLAAPRLRLRMLGWSGHRPGRRARTRLESLGRRRLVSGGARRLGRPVHRRAAFFAHGGGRGSLVPPLDDPRRRARNPFAVGLPRRGTRREDPGLARRPRLVTREDGLSWRSMPCDRRARRHSFDA